SYDPVNKLVNFAVFDSELKTFSVQLQYIGNNPSDFRFLRADITPNAATLWTTYSLPISSFAVTTLTGNPPDVPSNIQFWIGGDPANPGSSWGFDSGNVMMLDNLSYSVVPEPNTLVLVLWGGLFFGCFYFRPHSQRRFTSSPTV